MLDRIMHYITLSNEYCRFTVFAFFNDSRLCLVLKSFWGNYCAFMIHFSILNTDPVRRITACEKRHSILKELLKRHSRHSSYLSIISPVVCRLATLFPLMVLALIALRSECRTFSQQTNPTRPNVNTFYRTIKGKYYFTLRFLFLAKQDHYKGAPGRGDR